MKSSFYKEHVVSTSPLRNTLKQGFEKDRDHEPYANYCQKWPIEFCKCLYDWPIQILKYISIIQKWPIGSDVFLITGKEMCIYIYSNGSVSDSNGVCRCVPEV
jgi:hypothetical protein